MFNPHSILDLLLNSDVVRMRTMIPRLDRTSTFRTPNTTRDAALFEKMVYVFEIQTAGFGEEKVDYRDL